MKRLLLAIALLLGLADVAAAQNVTCATRPVTDNSNACANTAFVNSYVNNPSSPIYSTAHTWTATQTFNTNGTTIPGSVVPGTVLNVAGANGDNPRVVLNSYGAGARFTTYARSGTAASPTAVTAALADLGGLAYFGYDGSTFGSAGSVFAYATETWNTGAHGSKVCISTVPNTTTTVTIGLCQENSSGVTIGTPTGGDKGAGTLNLLGALYNNNTAPTGTGAYVRASNPTLVAPVLGAATATSITTPTVYGGTAAGSTLQLRATSNGAPSGDAVELYGRQIQVRALTGSTVDLVVGQAGTSNGAIYMGGATSGYTVIGLASAAVSGVWTLPSATDTFVGRATTDTLQNKTMSGTGAGNVFTNIPNSALVNASTTVNGQTCTLGSSCTVTASATTVTVGSTAVASGTNGYVLYNNSGTLGNLSTTGSGSVVLNTNANLTSPGIDTGLIYNTLNPSADGTVTFGTSSLRYATTYTNNITASGQAARTWSLARQTTAATAGQNLTIQAGGAVSGGTDLTGGNLILASGIATGSGGAVFSNGAIIFAGASSGGSSGTGDINPTEIMRISNAAGGYGILTFSGTDGNAYAITGAPADPITYFNGKDGMNVRVSNTDRVRFRTSLALFGIAAGDPILPAGATVHIGTGAAAAPVVTVCGTSPSIVGTDTAGEVTMGTGSPTTCVITFNVAYNSAPFCTVTWQGNPLATQNYTVSTSAITLAQTATSSNKVNYTCIARSGG